jgi:hypothetical protein
VEGLGQEGVADPHMSWALARDAAGGGEGLGHNIGASWKELLRTT